MFDLMPFGRRTRDLAGYFDDMEKSFFGDNLGGVFSCRTDVLDKGDHYELDAELPGFKKEDIRLDVENGYLTISAQHGEEHEEKDEKNYIRRERTYGSFRRSFDLSGVAEDGITAEYTDGVLKLTLPKKEAQPEPAAKRIEIR